MDLDTSDLSTRENIVMCRQFTKMMRYAQRLEISVSLTATLVQVSGADPNRVAILISGITTNMLRVSFSFTPPIIYDFQIGSAGPTQLITIADAGSIIQAPIWAATNTGTSGFCPITLFSVPPDILRRYLDGSDI